MKSLAVALSFLTRLPVGRTRAFDAADVARSSGWFPLIGILLGAIGGAAALVLRPHLPLTIVAVVLVALDAMLTGALHFDGLADTADGFGGGMDRESVLRIMRDHSIGSYGGVALVVLVGLKVASYSFLLQRNYWFAVVMLTPALGRWSMLLLAATLPYARQSPSVIEGMGRTPLIPGTLTILAALIAIQYLHASASRAWIATAAVIIVTVSFGLYCRHRIGGITGDTLGANLELCESAALIAFLWS